MIPGASRPGETRGRALIAAACIAAAVAILGAGCEAATWTGQLKACAEMCRGAASSFAVEFVPFVGSAPKCVCAGRQAADGGRP